MLIYASGREASRHHPSMLATFVFSQRKQQVYQTKKFGFAHRILVMQVLFIFFFKVKILRYERWREFAEWKETKTEKDKKIKATSSKREKGKGRKNNNNTTTPTASAKGETACTVRTTTCVSNSADTDAVQTCNQHQIEIWRATRAN